MSRIKSLETNEGGLPCGWERGEIAPRVKPERGTRAWRRFLSAKIERTQKKTPNAVD